MATAFPPAARLRSRPEFTRVQDNGRRVSTKFMTVLGHASASGRDRLGIIASRRLGGAVVRNRAKRRLREIFRRHAGVPVPASAAALDLVVIPRRELVAAPFVILEVDFQNAVRRLRAKS